MARPGSEGACYLWFQVCGAIVGLALQSHFMMRWKSRIAARLSARTAKWNGLSKNGSVRLASCLYEWRDDLARLSVEVYLTDCIVHDPPGGANVSLVTSANEALEGAARAYFPIGGPCPSESPTGGRSDSWGGLEIGASMMYRSQCVDGVVDAAGGNSLRQIRTQTSEMLGPLLAGDAISTMSTERLSGTCNFVVHAIAPFWSDDSWESALQRAYANAFDHVLRLGSTATLPLLGAGARGAPIDAAARVAASAVIEMAAQRRLAPTDSFTLRFGCLEKVAVDAIVLALLSRTGN